MPYIGKSPVGGGFHKLDSLTASATATYALTLGSAAYYPETANQLLVSLNGVIQAPQDSFTVSGSNLIFDTALTANDSIDFVVALGDVLGVGSVTDGAVTTAKIGNGAVTDAKIATMASSKLTGALPALDGSALTNVLPSVVAFHADTIAVTSAGNYVTFTNEVTDTASAYDNSNGTFTVPANAGGTYLFYTTINYDKNSTVTIDTNYCLIEMRKNNTEVASYISHYYGRGDYDYVAGQLIITLAAGDTMRVYNNGNATTIGGGYSHFNGFRIG